MTRAEDAIAEALDLHFVSVDRHGGTCGTCGRRVGGHHEVNAVIAAIRDLPDDDLAVLIRGEVDDEGYYGMDGEWHVKERRVVGPWRPADGLNGAGAATGAAEAATDAQGPA